jgi:hypothetical protein
MAYAVDTLTVSAKKPVGTPFALNVRSDDISGCETILASPGAGKRIALTGLIISSAAAITISIGEGNAGAALTAITMGPITFAAGQYLVWKFDHPLYLTADTILACDASGAGVVNIFVEGFTV